MKQLNDILSDVKVAGREGPQDPTISSLCFDSREAGKGSAFFALPGTLTDGHNYIDSAIEAGSHAVICERLPENRAEYVCYVMVEDAAEALGLASASFYDHPSERLRIIGVTGTNGKTTIATLLHAVFTEAGYPSGLLSTIRYLVGTAENKASHTTPDPLRINRLLNEMAEAGCSYCFMEVSSHAIHQKRIAGIGFSGGIFSNISHDHLDYHKTFREYIDAKKSFFDALPKKAFALTNMDDRNGEVMVQNCKAQLSTYGLGGPANFKGRIIESHMDGMQMMIDDTETWVRLTGGFNASNLLAVYGCAVLCGLDKETALTIISRQSPVRGRFEVWNSPAGITAVVDYAHTPDALKNVLGTINQLRSKTSQLLCVVGAGGNRDADKRPEMGRIAAELSQKLILTSDNPRDEEPGEIIQQMMEGVPEGKRKKVLSISDRKEAIKTAVLLASQGDVILVAGKGHESYQEIRGRKHHFDDMEVLQELMKTN